MESFRYDPIDLERPAFRLLRLLKGDGSDIACELFQAFLDEREIAVSYEALSYTWGSAEICDGIEVNGRWLPITLNLYRALQDLRLRDQDRVLWVDAICIDQGHMKERGHQVQQMGEIYKHAEQVIFWLGQATYETTVVIDTLRQLQIESRRYVCKDWKLTDQRWLDVWMTVQPILKMKHADLIARQREGLRSLLDRSWFRRVWILQEVANARAALVYCGAKYVQARFLSLAPLLIGVIPEAHCQAVLDIFPGPARKDSWWGQSRDLYTLLRNFGRSEAQDERDMIYALLGMLSDANKSDILRPDYEKTVQELTLDVIHFLYFDKNNLDTIGFFRLNQLGGIRSLLLKLGALNKTALERQTTLSQKENVSTILRRLDFELTGEMIMATTEHNTDTEIIKLFQQQQLYASQISVEILNDASQYLSRGKRLAELSLRYQGDELKGRDAVVRVLLRTTEYISYNERDGTRRTQISYAAEKGHVALVKLLLATGANFEAKDKLRGTPLIQAAWNGHGAVVRLLVDQGADLEAKWSDRTPLLWAAGEGHEDVVKLLLDRSADLEAKDRLSQTPLYRAAMNGHVAVVKLLLDRGADLETRNKYGQTPLSLAAENGHVALMKLLLDRGADLETKDRFDSTPLSLAARTGQAVIVKLLLDYGAAFKPNNQGWGQLKHVARNHADIKMMLLNRGAEI